MYRTVRSERFVKMKSKINNNDEKGSKAKTQVKNIVATNLGIYKEYIYYRWQVFVWV